MDLDYIESLAQLLKGSQVTELKVRRGHRSITVKRPAGAIPVAEPLPAATTEAAEAVTPRLAVEATQLPAPMATETALVPVANGQEAAEARFEILRARRVGIFHRGANADGAALIAIGDWAAAKQQLGSVESMRLFDEVDSPVNGRVVGVFVGDGEPVEYGQPLFHLEVMDQPVAEQEES